MKPISIWTALFVSVFSGYLLGFASYRVEQKTGREPSSASVSLNDYKNIPCLPESEYRQHAKDLNLKVEEGNSCEHKYHGKFSRLLFLAEKFRTKFPRDWAPKIQADLADTVHYMKKFNHTFGFDIVGTEDHVVAYNTADKNKIDGRDRAVMFGPYFFKDDPFASLGTMVHESHHSASLDPGHTTCRLGDIPGAPGGCDHELSLTPGKAGAYSYEAALLAGLALYADGLSDGDREDLKANSIYYVSTRFNELPIKLAQRFDLLIGLNEDGTTELVHPFLPKALPGPTFPERVKRIELFVLHGGLLAYLDSNKIMDWRPGRKALPTLSSYVGNDYKALELSRIYAPATVSPSPYITFLREDNELEYLRFDAAEMKYLIVPYKRHPLKKPTNIRHKNFFLGPVGTLFLSADGGLYKNFSYGSDDPYMPAIIGDADNTRWAKGTAGVLGESLYLISEGGQLFSGEPEYDQNNDGYLYRVKPVESLVAGPITKLLEGIDLRAVLSKQGELFVGRYGEVPRKMNLPQRYKDFAILRPTRVEKEIISSEKMFTAAEKVCGIRSPIYDPWLNGAMGINEQKRLVFAMPTEADGANCFTDEQSGPYESVQVVVTEADAKTKNPYKLPGPAIQLQKSDGNIEIRRPYEW